MTAVSCVIPAQAGIHFLFPVEVDKPCAVYILTSRPRGTLYVGVTSDLVKRVHEHKEGLVEGFTKTYAVKTLVWFELTENIEAAIQREKQIKKWNRAWKLEMIEKLNPEWRDLYPEIVG